MTTLTTFTAAYTDGAGTPRVSAPVTLQDSADPGLPVVILLHGFGGTVEDMTNPAIHPGFNFDCTATIPPLVDRGWHHHPGLGIYGVELDPTKGVTGWDSALLAEGFGTVSYAQVDSTGLLDPAIRELAAVVDEVLLRIPADRQLALVAHSRGGLLARRYLLDVAAVPLVRDRFVALVTLHSPHLGTELANLSSELNVALTAIIAANPALGPALLGVQAMVNAPAYQELAVGSPFLTALAAAEATGGAPILPTYTWSGTSTLLSRSRAWVFTPGSAVPRVTSLFPLRIQFHWETVPVELPSLVAGLPALGLLAPELRDTEGDVLVAETRSHVAGEAADLTHALNHAEPLWDPTLQQEVFDVLRAAIS